MANSSVAQTCTDTKKEEKQKMIQDSLLILVDLLRQVDDEIDHLCAVLKSVGDANDL